jgi:Protein of unknown function (DUF3500)
MLGSDGRVQAVCRSLRPRQHRRLKSPGARRAEPGAYETDETSRPRAYTDVTAETAAARVAGLMAIEAQQFLESLRDDQRQLAEWRFSSDEERRRWYYTPTDHGGLPLASMRPAQQRLAMRLVASGLSRPGYVTVSTIIGLENVLDELEGWKVDWGRERGRDPGLYYLRVFGDPASRGPWSWRFGGHHVSVHHLVVDGEVRASTPLFFGADPASSPLLGPQPLRPLAAAEDLARELLHALDRPDRSRAIISPVAPTDLVGGNRPRLASGDAPRPLADIWRGRFEGALGEQADSIQQRFEAEAGLTRNHLDAVRLTDEAKGVRASTMTASQQQLLRDLLDVYLRRIPDGLAELEREKYTGERLGALWFAWAGGTDHGEGHYYRVQGPGLLVEYDNTQRGANHVHSVWRDPEGDFGDDVIRSHYSRHH